MPFLEAEVAGQTAAPAGQLTGETRAFTQPAVGRVPEHRVLVAVRLAGDGAVQPRRRPVRRELLQRLGEGADGRGEPSGPRLVGTEEFGQVGAERGRAARFEDDERQAGVEHAARAGRGCGA